MAKIGNPMQALPSQMINAYFDQAEQYFSESETAFLQVSEMHVNHAANAAAKLLDDSYRWSMESNVTTRNPQLWMIRQPLFLALVARANRL